MSGALVFSQLGSWGRNRLQLAFNNLFLWDHHLFLLHISPNVFKYMYFIIVGT